MFNYFGASAALLAFVSLPVHSDTLSITPDQIIQKTLDNNFKIQMAKLDYLISEGELTKAKSSFDYELSLKPELKREKVLSNLSYEDEVSGLSTYGLSLAFGKKFSWGMTTELNVQTLKVHDAASTSTVPSRFQGGGSVKLTQPLLKGGWFASNENSLNKSIAKRDRFKWKLVQTVDEQLEDAFRAYWELYQAQINLEIKKVAFEVAQENLKSTRALNRAGKKSRVDLFQAQANQELACAKWEQEKTKLLEAREKLFKAIMPANEANVDIELVAQVSRPLIDKNDLDRKIAVWNGKKRELSLKHPRYLSSLTQVTEAQSDFDKSKNDLLPQLDLTAEYSTTGIGTEWDESINQFANLKHPSYQVALELSIPIPHRAARGGYHRYFSARERAEAESKREFQLVAKEADTLTHEIQRAVSAHQSLRSRLKKEKEKVGIKKRLYRAGRISWQEYFEGVDQYNELLAQETQELVALNVAYHRISNRLGTVGQEEKNRFFNKLNLNL